MAMDRQKTGEVPERARAIIDALARIPADRIAAKLSELMDAKRWVNMGRDREAVQEADSAVQLRAVELVITQGAGQAPRRADAPATTGAEEPKPGMIAPGKVRTE